MLVLAAAAPSRGPAPDLVVTSARRLPLASQLVKGTIEHRRLALHGVPLRGAVQTVEIASDGTERRLNAASPVHAPQVTPDEALIARDDVPGLIADALGLSGPPQLEAMPELVYLVVLEQPVLAWEATIQFSLRPTPSRRTVWLSAMSGRLLEVEEHVKASRARVFAENPSKTPVPIEVELTGIDVTDAGHHLDGERVVSMNCVADEPEEVPEWYDEGDCYPLQIVTSDDNGDFFVSLPDVIDPLDGVQASDEYAELSMYHHSEVFLEAMRGLGVLEYRCVPALVLANVRELERAESTPELDYTPLNNAFYTDQCDPERGATMFFGQGTEVDFGYDADVIYHELGHGMVALLTSDGLGARRHRSDASVVDAGALNEAVADYFTFLMTDDPSLAEYVGRFWSSSSKGFIRSGLNTKTCPSDNISQVHNDGEPVQAALWATRSRVGEILDRIVLLALTRIPNDATIEEFAGAVLEVADEFRADGDFDDFGYDVLHRSFEARGLLDCPRVITDPDEVGDGRTMHLRGKTATIQPFTPGAMQLRYEVPAGATAAQLSYRLSSRDDELDALGLVLVKRADEPIQYEYELIAVNDLGDPTGTVNKIREVTNVSGDWDEEIEGVHLTGNEYQAAIDGLQPGEVIHVTLVVTGQASATASGVFISAPGVPENEEGGSSSGGSEPEADDEERVQGDGAVAGRCGCRTSTPGSGLLALLALLGLRRRRWFAS